MVGAAITDGDILVVNASLRPQTGDIVVAALEGEFLVKRYSVQKTKTYLVAENKNFKPILINPDDEFTIFGVVTGVVREVKKV
jgi:DNA polymerase V